MTAGRGSRALVLSGLALLLIAIALSACARQAPVVIGGLVSQTGAAATYGKMARQGMDLAIEEINAAGGLPSGRKLEIEYRDDGSSPDSARTAVADLVGKARVNAIVGGITSQVAQGVLPQILEREVVMLSPSASNPGLSAMGGGWFFRDYPSDTAEVETMVRLARRLDIDDAVVLAQAETFGHGLAELFKHGFEVGGGNVKLIAPFPLDVSPTVATDLAKQVVATKAGVVYLAGYETEIASLLQALKKEGYAGLKLASSALTTNIVKLSGDASDRLVFPQSAANLESDDPHVKAFTAAFRKKYGAEPSTFAAYGYDAVRVLAQALGKTQVGSAGEIRDQLVRIDYHGVTGPIKFDKTGDVRREPHLYAVVRGEMIHIEDDRDVRGVLLQ